MDKLGKIKDQHGMSHHTVPLMESDLHVSIFFKVLCTMSYSRIIFLPQEAGEISQISSDLNLSDSSKLINLPNLRTSTNVKYLLHQGLIYELRRVNGKNPYLKPGKTVKNVAGEPIKSILIEENSTKSNDGQILENPSVIVATKFSIAYLLIGFFLQYQQKNTRYASLEDIIDSMSLHFEAASHLSPQLIKSGLVDICDSLNQDDEDFYKYSQEKSIGFITERVEKLAQNFPASIWKSKVEEVICPANFDTITPEEIKHDAKIRFSLYLVSSYIPSELTLEIENHYKGTFDRLNQYIKGENVKRDSKKIACQKLSNLNGKLHEETFRNKKSFKKKPQVVKKKASKGALDNFFKKA